MEKYISCSCITTYMGDVCVDKAEEIYKQLKSIDESIQKLNPDDPKSLYLFKPEYERLLKVIENTKDLTTCPVPALKNGDNCTYMSPLEPVTLGEYAGLPIEGEPYTILDEIRRQGHNGNINKIADIVKDIEERLDIYLHGVKECKIDVPEEDIDSMMLQLGINPDDYIEKEDTQGDSNTEATDEENTNTTN